MLKNSKRNITYGKFWHTSGSIGKIFFRILAVEKISTVLTVQASMHMNMNMLYMDSLQRQETCSSGQCSTMYNVHCTSFYSRVSYAELRPIVGIFTRFLSWLVNNNNKESYKNVYHIHVQYCLFIKAVMVCLH